jgi:hypothetical protein
MQRRDGRDLVQAVPPLRVNNDPLLNFLIGLVEEGREALSEALTELDSEHRRAHPSPAAGNPAPLAFGAGSNDQRATVNSSLDAQKTHRVQRCCAVGCNGGPNPLKPIAHPVGGFDGSDDCDRRPAARNTDPISRYLSHPAPAVNLGRQTASLTPQPADAPSTFQPHNRSPRGPPIIVGLSASSFGFSSAATGRTQPAPIPIAFDAHTTWRAIYVHTAKCDGCNKHNSSVLQQCCLCALNYCEICMNDETRRDWEKHTPSEEMDWKNRGAQFGTRRGRGKKVTMERELEKETKEEGAALRTKRGRAGANSERSFLAVSSPAASAEEARGPHRRSVRIQCAAEVTPVVESLSRPLIVHLPTEAQRTPLPNAPRPLTLLSISGDGSLGSSIPRRRLKRNLDEEPEILRGPPLKRAQAARGSRPGPATDNNDRNIDEIPIGPMISRIFNRVSFEKDMDTVRCESEILRRARREGGDYAAEDMLDAAAILVKMAQGS